MTAAARIDGRATRVAPFDFSSAPMRAFHMAWLSFLACFFAWFGVAPLMPIIRKELALTDAQVGWSIIASVATTIAARLLAGWLCDRFGPRRTYGGLLILGALPVMAIGLAHDFASFLALRMMVGAVGASFVITQFHTSRMFAPRCVGTANAIAAGIGNSGAGVANMAMPLIATFIGGTLGFGSFWGWRLAMVAAGLVMVVLGVAYLRLTEDAPRGYVAPARASSPGFIAASRDPRVWALFGAYAACFGVELTIHNVAALYFVDRFHADLVTAGLAAGSFGVLAVFARAAGGLWSDRVASRHGLRGRTILLGSVLFAEGATLLLFAAAPTLALAIPALVLFGCFVHLSCGATFAVVPFVKPDALGAVSGIVGAGGNAGAVVAGLLFRGSIPWPSAFATVGVVVIVSSALTLFIRFSREAEAESLQPLGVELPPAA